MFYFFVKLCVWCYVGDRGIRNILVEWSIIKKIEMRCCRVFIENLMILFFRGKRLFLFSRGVK